MKKLFLIVVVTVCVASGVRGFTQTPDAPAAPVQTTSQTQGARKAHLGRQLAEESREAAGEDDTAQFKRSGAVQFVARITGLDMEHAYWLCVVLNFAIVAVAIFWFSRKNLPSMFRNRTALIQKAMEEARQASADANRRLSEVEARLSKLGAEIAAMSAAGEKEAAAEEERIKAAAEEDARRIVAAAEHEIDAAAKSARRDLTAFVADLAVSLAKRQIHVDESSDQALVGSFASQLSGNGEARKDQR
ncbi:MAG: ATP synthase F0 subunit B [Terriglobales bacterium]|jgi:F-type H+-transporting ATPase subunit b